MTKPIRLNELAEALERAAQRGATAVEPGAAVLDPGALDKALPHNEG